MVLALTGLLIGVGTWSMLRLPIDAVPDVTNVQVQINTNAPALSPVEVERHAFAYVFEGYGTFRAASEPFGVLTEKEIDGQETVVRERTGNRSLVLFDTGDEVTVQAGDEGIRFLLVSGKPLKEPVAWYGPIVMNTQAEIRQAMLDFNSGRFGEIPR